MRPYKYNKSVMFLNIKVKQLYYRHSIDTCTVTFMTDNAVDSKMELQSFLEMCRAQVTKAPIYILGLPFNEFLS